MLLRALQILAALLVLAGLAVAAQHLRLSATRPLPEKPDGSLRVATWNVHYIVLRQIEGRWGLSGWEARKGPLSAVFGQLDADLVAFQEMESWARGSDGSVNLARDWLLQEHPGYAPAATGDWRSFPSTQPIFYRTERLEPLDQGWFFFSETPDVLYSRTFNGSFPAFATWVRFRDRQSGAVFRALNVHLDAFSRDNRLRSTRLIAERLAPWVAEGEAVVLLGDLNALHGSALHRMLTDAGLRFVDIPGATFHLDRGLHLFGAIDHIGVTPQVTPAGEAVVLRSRGGDVWPTDHYPVLLDLRVAP